MWICIWAENVKIDRESGHNSDFYVQFDIFVPNKKQAALLNGCVIVASVDISYNLHRNV